MPLAVYVLGLSIFCMGTTEVMLAGLLPALSAGLQVSIPTAGLLISGFAIGIVVGGPVLTVGLSSVVRRTALIGLLGVFIAGQLLAAIAPGYTMLMVSRVTSAMAFGAFFGIGASVAVELAGRHSRAKAVSIMVGGLTLANVFGMPAATLIGQHLHWRASFLGVAAISALCLIMVVRLVPRQPKPEGIRIRSELTVFARPQLWAALLTSALFLAAAMSAFSYLAPLLTEVAGFSTAAVPALLFLYGAGSFLGIYLGGRFADRRPVATATVSLAGLCAALVLLAGVAADPVAVVIATLLLGVGAFAPNPALTARAMREADDGPLAAASNTSALNIGITVGPWVGGMVINAGLGYVAPVWVGLVFAVACLTSLLIAEAARPNSAAPREPATVPTR